MNIDDLLVKFDKLPSIEIKTVAQFERLPAADQKQIVKMLMLERLMVNISHDEIVKTYVPMVVSFMEEQLANDVKRGGSFCLATEAVHEHLDFLVESFLFGKALKY